MSYDQYQHFILEKKLSAELRNASLQERKELYRKLYDQLFTTFPEISHGINETGYNRLDWEVKFIRPFFNPQHVILEVGAGDCLLSKELAKYFKKVVAYEVADAIPFVENKPANLELKFFNGIDMFEEKESFDVIYSNQVFEHLHPDDTIPLLQTYSKFLKSNGKLILITPHRLTGPHDISRFFTDTPEGFHLKEYTYSELTSLLLSSGFSKVKAYVGHKKAGYFPVSTSLIIAIEKIYDRFPMGLKRKLRSNSLLLNLFGMKLVAWK